MNTAKALAFSLFKPARWKQKRPSKGRWFACTEGLSELHIDGEANVQRRAHSCLMGAVRIREIKLIR